jgi:CBS domain containing-hemolysin-like protein
MVPLTRLTAVPPDIPVSQARHLAGQNSFSAMPVLGDLGSVRPAE